MILTRRAFSLLSIAAGAGAAAGLVTPRSSARLAPDAPSAATPTAVNVFEWKPIGDAGVARLASGQGGNAMLLISNGEALLIDCKNAGYGDALRQEAEGFGTKLTCVINTHHHADHTGGNTAFTKDTPVLAQDRCADRVEKQLDNYLGALRNMAKPHADADPAFQKAALAAKGLVDRVDTLTGKDFRPTDTFGTARTFRTGKYTIEMRHVGPGHTDNDVFVFVPELNVLHTGDLLFFRLHPFVDGPSGADTRGWQRSIAEMLKICNDKTIVVPGHGELTDASGLRAQSAYFDAVRAGVAAAIKEGKTKEEVQKLMLPAFEGLGFEQVRPRALGAVYDELSKG